MLHKFKFENFKSFHEQAELNFVASRIKEHEAWVARDVQGERILKVLAVFGANGAGKSNMISAFAAMQRFINLSLLGKSWLSIWSKESSLQPFAFTDKQGPTSFEVVLSLQNKIYKYGFCANAEMVLHEYLLVRDGQTKKQQYKTLFRIQDKKLVELAEVFQPARELFKSKRMDALFLSAAIAADFAAAKEIYAWFAGALVVNYSSDWMESDITQGNSSIVKVLLDEGKKQRLLKFIRGLDLGIAAIEVEKLELGEDCADKYQVVTYHKDEESGKTYAFPLIHESSGTRKLIALFDVLDDALNTGKTIFIDELDAKLHPMTLQKLLALFRNPVTNPHNGQIIFVSKDIFNLNRDVLRRDEVWFVSKNKKGESSVYALNNIDLGKKKVRNDASFVKDYILGKYGAIPEFNRN